VAALTTAALFVLLPLVFVLVQGVTLREAFRLAPVRWPAFLAAAIFGLTLWPLAHEVFLLNKLLGLNPLTAERVEATEKLLQSWRHLSPLLILASLAVVPALCEEFFFRGYLFSAFRRKFSPLATILITALLFGSFHVVVSSLLAVERFLPSTFLGLILGWVCWRTGSVLPGMLLHACHNGLLLLLACYRDALAKLSWNISEQSHLPAAWLIASLIGAIVAGVILSRLRLAPEVPAGSSGAVLQVDPEGMPRSD
jgi:ABC-2 type transport system permease protein/sodium transport system permease protein